MFLLHKLTDLKPVTSILFLAFLFLLILQIVCVSLFDACQLLDNKWFEITSALHCNQCDCRFTVKMHHNVCLVFCQSKFNICVRCDMAFIEPLHRNKPNITYLLTYRKNANIRCTLVSSKIVVHSDVVGASAVGRCSNYIFILDLTPDFNGSGKNNSKMRWENLTSKFLDLVRPILEV